MNRYVLVSLFKSVVLLDIVQVVPPDDYGSLHLLAFHHTSQNAASDANIASERAFLVNICTFTSLRNLVT